MPRRFRSVWYWLSCLWVIELLVRVVVGVVVLGALGLATLTAVIVDV